MDAAALRKATGLHVQERLSIDRALHATSAAGYRTAFDFRRLSPTAIRLTVCDGWWDLIRDGEKVGQFCGNTIQVTVRARHGRVDVLKNGRRLPTPDRYQGR